MDLEYTVTNQVIEKSNRGRPANLSQKYLRLCFEFTEDWTGLTKFALFKVGTDNYRQALEADKVIVPALVLRNKKFLFTLYGIDNNDLRVTTNMVRVDLLESGFVHEAIGDDELDDPNVVEEIYLELDKKVNITSLTSGYYTKTEVDNLIDSVENKILLTSEKTIIQTGETNDFTAKVKQDGFPLNNETVELYKGEDMRVKLGEATTNSQGIAVYEYTGTGAGELKVKAKAGTLLSETYELYDCTFFDDGISENTQYYNHQSRTTDTYDATGRTLTNSTGTTSHYYLVAPPTTPSSASDSRFSADYCIELDLISYDGAGYIYITDGTNAFYRSWANLGLEGGEHIRCEIKSNSQKIYIDDNQTASWSATNNYTNTSIDIALGSGKSVKYKNLKVYPI